MAHESHDPPREPERWLGAVSEGSTGGLKVLVLGGRTEGYHQFPIMGPILETFLKRAGMSPTLTEDRDALKESSISNYDVFLDYTTGEKLEPHQLEGLLGFVSSGKGFVGLHCAADSFRDNAEYIEMLGGKFRTHPPMQTLPISVEDLSHPITAAMAPFEIFDELYVLDYAPGMHWLLSSEWEGEKQPVAWVKEHGRGRLFYLSLGHGPEAFNNPSFQKLVTRGIHWVAMRT